MFGNRLNLIKSILIQLFLLTSVCSVAMESPKEDNQNSEKFPRLVSYDSLNASPGLSTIFSPIASSKNYQDKDSHSFKNNLDSSMTTPIPVIRQNSYVSLESMVESASMDSDLFGRGKDDGLNVQDLQCSSSVFENDDRIAHACNMKQLCSAICNLQAKNQKDEE